MAEGPDRSPGRIASGSYMSDAETGSGSQRDESMRPAAKLTLDAALALKEAVTTALAFGISVVTLWMLVTTFKHAGTLGEKKDILMLGLGLLGTVTGFYLGRVPAERAADAAQKQAQDAERKGAQDTATALEALDDVSRQLRDTAADGGIRESVSESVAATAPSVESALARIEAARRALARR